MWIHEAIFMCVSVVQRTERERTAQLFFPSTGPVSQGKVLDVADVTEAPQIALDVSDSKARVLS